MKTYGKFFGITELARRIRVTSKTAKKYVDAGIIPLASINPLTGFRMFDQNSVDEYYRQIGGYEPESVSRLKRKFNR